MHTAAILNFTRLDAYIGDVAQYPDQTDLVLLGVLTGKLHTVFNDIVVKAREGYWLKSFLRNSVSGQGRYRIPPRSVVGGLESIEVAPSGVYYPLDLIPRGEMPRWEGSIANGNPGLPRVYCVIGDQCVLWPTPNQVFPIRMNYYLRPSVLTASQNNQNWFGISGGTDRGRITSFSNTLGAKQILVNTKPFDNSIAIPAVMTTQNIDIVHADGWHELAVVNAAQTTGGSLQYNFADSVDLSDVEVGDYVRVADQTDWPCLPDDAHPMLCAVGAIKVAIEVGTRETGDELAQNVESDLIRFRSELVPRAKSSPKTTPVSLKTRDMGIDD